MSRLSTLSPNALRALLSPESDANLVCLVTIYDPVNPNTVVARLSDNVGYNLDGSAYRISETADDIVYGLSSRGNNFIFLPLNISLPNEEHGALPHFNITIHDVTRQLIPLIRQFGSSPNVLLELVLSSSPDEVEASFPNFKMSSISYNANTITADLTIESFAVEPFPQHTFTPAYFPGLF